MSQSRRSVMTHQFSQIPNVEIPRSSFDRSHGLKTTFDAGYLIPILVDEALPGDTFNCSMSAFARLATPIKPVMDNMFIDTFFFAVPNRLVWLNWEEFNGEQRNPGDSTDFVIPLIQGEAEPGSIHDYMGIPTGIPNLEWSSLFARAYNLIWNEWFRDENLQDSLFSYNGDGNGTASVYTLQKRGKRHDYFTSALPWPQKGDPVTIPIAGDARIMGIGKINQTYNQSNVTSYEAGSYQMTYPSASQTDLTGGPLVVREDADRPGFPDIYADLSSATATTINELRQAFQIQRLLERDARGGTRYTEIIRSHFGVTSPDQRLQRPEYLGGGTSAINITPVPQTTPDGAGDDTPQGNLAAIGTASATGHGFTKSFTEHSMIIGLVSVRADLTYQQGLNRMWSRTSRFDFYWPSLSHIGEQAILNKEIFAQGTIEDEDVFGYQERYAEYRYKPSMITGKFRSSDPQSLDVWHLSQDFGNLPVLDADFIEDNPPIDRIVAVPSEPQFLFDAYFSMRCARPMPLYGVPGLIDHF